MNRLNPAGRLVARIVREEWDPLGVGGQPGAESEYDAYVGHIAWLVSRASSAEELFSNLYEIETADFGLGDEPVRRARTMDISRRLFEVCRGSKEG